MSDWIPVNKRLIAIPEPLQSKISRAYTQRAIAMENENRFNHEVLQETIDEMIDAIDLTHQANEYEEAQRAVELMEKLG